MQTLATFLIEGRQRAAIDALEGLGFTFAPVRETTTTLLDTFDGRLHAAGLRLEATGSGPVEVELSGPDTPPAHAAVSAVPRWPADLPPGPLRSRIAALIDVRALLPQLRVGARRIPGVRRDAAGKVVATALVQGAVHVLDRPDVEPLDATIEIRPVPGYPKPAHRTVAALRDLGLPECGTDTLTYCASAAGVDLRGFQATATVPLDPSMTAIDGFRLVLANLADVIEANWSGTIDQADPEFLHDLRIAVRRTRTVLAAAKGVLPAAARDHARTEFAWLAGLTSAPRDLDVYLLEWSRYTDPLGADVAPRLEPVRALLERRRADVHAELERGLRSDRAAELIRAWPAWLAEPIPLDDLPRRAAQPLGPIVARRIARAHRTLLERGRMIEAETPAERVHDRRKDAKKLRYLLECFGTLLPTAARKTYVRRLKGLQDNLGEHQDAEVHVTMLRAVAGELHDTSTPADTMVAIGQLTERLEQQRLNARAEFAERFADYDAPATRRALEAMLEGIAG